MLFNLFHVLLVVSLLVVCLDLGLEEIRAARRTRDLIELVLRTALILDLFFLIWTSTRMLTDSGEGRNS